MQIMFSKQFWKIKSKIVNFKFQLQKLLYGIRKKIDNCKKSASFSSILIKTFVMQILKAVILASVLLYSDIYIVPLIADQLLIINLEPINTTLAADIIIGGLGVAGVILGLYCSNITSTYSTKYSNAPSNLATLFQRDVITNQCVKRIVGYMIICVVMLGESILGINISYISIIALLILTVRMVITFSITGNRSSALSNTFQISENIYPEIISAIDHAAGKSFFATDVNFQHHFQKVCSSYMSDLKDISYFNKDIPLNQNGAMVSFMSKNILLLGMYWQKKSTIRFDSLWYRDKTCYSQWHLATDSNIEIALKTGTELQTSNARDYAWFENNIDEINNICFEKLCLDKDYKSIYHFLVNSIIPVSQHAIKSRNISLWIISIEYMNSRVALHCDFEELDDENIRLVAAIYDAIVTSYISIIVGINHYLTAFDLHVLLDNVVKMASSKRADFSRNELCNNELMASLLQKISVEMQLEGKLLTPSWYIKQVASKEVVIWFNQIADAISKTINNVFEMGTSLHNEKGQNFPAAVVFEHMYELLQKSELSVNMLDQKYSAMQGLNIEPTIVWDSFSTKIIKENMTQIKKQIPKYLVSCCGAFALTHWVNRENYPDLLGFCYNNICEALINALEQNDFEAFKSIYPGFLSLMLLYHEYVRCDVIRIKEPHVQQSVYHVATGPIIDYAMISGLAIIWGEFCCSNIWSELIRSELQHFVEKDPKNIETLSLITQYATYRKNHMFAIGNRDVLHTGWKIRIENAIKASNDCKYEYKEYGQKVLVTESFLLTSFCGTYFDDLGFSHDAEDVYFCCCVNKYLPVESKYRCDLYDLGLEDYFHEDQ